MESKKGGTLLKIAFAAFVHDIGAVAGEGLLQGHDIQVFEEVGLDQPYPGEGTLSYGCSSHS